MSNGPLIQNLRGGRALIVAEQDVSTSALVATLRRLGITPIYVRADSPELDPVRLDPDRDVLLVDGDVVAGLPVPLSSLAQLSPAPVIGLVGNEAPSQLRQLIALGATAFLRKPIHHGSIYSALFLCVNEYRRRMLLERQVQELQHRRGRRRFVIKAVLQVMQRDGVDDDTAYDHLRRQSMHMRQSLEDYCESLVGQSVERPTDKVSPEHVENDIMPDKERDNASQHGSPATQGHSAGGVADPDLDPSLRRRSDQARRA